MSKPLFAALHTNAIQFTADDKYFPSSGTLDGVKRNDPNAGP